MEIGGKAPGRAKTSGPEAEGWRTVFRTPENPPVREMKIRQGVKV